ncbi:SDR family oxidoreductase [Amycolatopsis sp. NPDC049253]|uniref:SDR family oxidoreductase n=1 Tax=Amycolatopsis sp. NPDC049253 TaxID=3155274 RepID=UPI00341AC8C7
MTTYGELATRTAVVTGAASGMGAATARLLARSGARVALLARRRAVLDELVADLGATTLAVPADLTDAASVQAAVDAVHERFGPVDLVVNAAGVMLPNPMTEGREDEWQRMIDTNLAGPLRVIHGFGADLRAAAAEGRPADLVNISSVAAHLAMPEYAVYNATKAAVTHLSASLRQEFGAVRVTNLEPGLTRTELGAHIDNAAHSAQLDRTFDAFPSLEPEDVADLIAYLVTRPAHVNLRQGIVVPTRQPS